MIEHDWEKIGIKKLNRFCVLSLKSGRTSKKMAEFKLCLFYFCLFSHERVILASQSLHSNWWWPREAICLFVFLSFCLFVFLSFSRERLILACQNLHSTLGRERLFVFLSFCLFNFLSGCWTLVHVGPE